MSNGVSSPLSYIIKADGADARLLDAALLRAIEHVNADGGVIAIRDDSASAMILRNQQVHPRFYDNVPFISKHEHEDDSLDRESTTVLPASHLVRIFRKGEGVIGHVWDTGEAVIMSGKEVQVLPHGQSAEFENAAWIMAAPIYSINPGEYEANSIYPIVIGVIVVFVSEPQWRFTQHHLKLLQLEAHIVSQAIKLSLINQQERKHRRLLSLLQEMTHNFPFQSDSDSYYEGFAERIYSALDGVVEIHAFALGIVKNYTANSRPLDPIIQLYGIYEKGERLPPQKLPISAAPWWQTVYSGQPYSWIQDSERIATPSLSARQWGNRQYMDSQIYIPIQGSQEIIGALLIAHQNNNAYSYENVILLQTVSRFIGVAIENARLRASHLPSEDLQQSQFALALLNNAILGLNESLDTREIIKNLVEQGSDLARGQHCVFVEYNEKKDELILQDGAQFKDHSPYKNDINISCPVGSGRRRKAIEGETVRLEDLNEEYHRGDIIGNMLERHHVIDAMLLPIIYSESVTRFNKILGFMIIYSPDQRIMVTPAETMNLLALGRVAAAAMYNAKTYSQLREVDKMKDEFILTASHEFRTPMSAIQGFSWLIQKRVDSMTQEQGKHWASEIIRSTEQLKDMIDSITEAWRTQSISHVELQKSRIDQALAQAIEISAGTLSRFHHEVTDIAVDSLTVLADPDRLRHVISNLLINAAKYSPDHQNISVSAAAITGAELCKMTRERGLRDDDEEFVSFVQDNQDKWCLVRVQDDGIGISQENMKRLFAKFVRLELTTNIRGTGLGLYICRRYIESMGGEIWVDSKLGQGSTFSFCLKLEQQIPAEP